MLRFVLREEQEFVRKLCKAESKGENMFNEFVKELGEEYEGYILEDLDRGMVKIVVKKDGRKADVVIPYDIFMGNPVGNTEEFLRNLAKSLVDELNRR